MRFIPTAVHGLIDYVMGLFLIASPFFLGFRDDGAATWVPVVLGVGMVLVSLFTDNEAGLARRIPMPTHLGLDLLSGAFLALSPWLLGFSERVWVPHRALGLAEVAGSLTTKAVPSDRAAERAARP
ncbi:SPW repeat protein [Calidithermus terrae]|uniref:SPW repeat protein n=1 Tax=Calidithermus terrae TaxID=1408545 RepID=A0A399EDX7_9DEIN|nr:SPW repeat protein [Calidithermus terrae]RIH82006.1 SPW repeat protein [Calidithermus terrae]